MTPGIVFSDVDGTLLNSRYKMLPGTRLAIRKLQAKNIPFVIVSARSPFGIRPIMRKNDFSCPMICYNGALILDKDEKVLCSEGFDRKDTSEIIRYIEEMRFDCAWNIYSMDTWMVGNRRDIRIRREEDAFQTRAVEGRAEDLGTDAKIGKILCICNPGEILEIEHALKEEFHSLSIARSADCYLEIMPAGITKAKAVRTLCHMWNIPLEAAMAFGDHYNDVEMLSTVAMPFLMGNAPEELKIRFDRITSSNDEEGIYTALKEMGLI